MSERSGRLKWVRRCSVLPLLLLIFSGGCEPPAPYGVATGKRSPEISGKDVTGKTIKLSDYKGKVVLLDFWGTWCGWCIKMIPKEYEMMKTYKGRPFTILGICKDEPANLEKFLAQLPLPWPNLLATDSLIQAWKIDGFPAYILIDDEGVIQGRWIGASEKDIAAMEAAVAHAIQVAEGRSG